MRFKFTIDMKWINNDDNSSITISAENIKSLIIDSNYDTRYMDICYAIIVLDKNDIDKIILHAKTSSIHMNIYKINADQDPPSKVLTDFSGEMLYFINRDINYNKEIDYAKESSTSKDS